MAKGFKHGTSSPLNFKVKDYETADALQAATPKENTIGIITTTPITSWIFSAAEPETVADGMVWISTGTSSQVEFNALKKNGIQVYPLQVKQYISGAWVDVTAMSYQDGEWIELGGAKYIWEHGGKSNTAVFGELVYTHSTRMTIGDTIIGASPDSNSQWSVLTEKTIADMVTKPTKLFFDASIDNIISAADGAWRLKFGVCKTTGGSASATSNFYAYKSFTATAERQTYELDISTLTDGYFCFGGIGTMTVYNWWTE